jgi:hypothetical protein
MEIHARQSLKTAIVFRLISETFITAHLVVQLFDTRR